MRHARAPRKSHRPPRNRRRPRPGLPIRSRTRMRACLLPRTRYLHSARMILSDVLTCTVPPLRVESSLLKKPIPPDKDKKERRKICKDRVVNSTWNRKKKEKANASTPEYVPVSTEGATLRSHDFSSKAKVRDPKSFSCVQSSLTHKTMHKTERGPHWHTERLEPLSSLGDASHRSWVAHGAALTWRRRPRGCSPA